MPHKVGEECDVIAALQEALCKAMAEGMWVNDHWVDAIPDSHLFELPGNTSGGDSVPVFI